MKIVCDTNVLVSGILFQQGYPRQILILISNGTIANFTSPALLTEIEEVLCRPKFQSKIKEVASVISLFRDTFELIYPSQTFHVVMEDPDDNKVLDAAYAASVDFIVSGDKHLLSLKQWENISILSPAQFVKYVSQHV